MMEKQTGVITGDDFVYAYAPLNSGDMVLCMVSPFMEAYAIIPKLFTSITVSILAMLAIGIIISSALAKSITTPFAWVEEQLTKLAKGITKLSEGKMGYKNVYNLKF